MTSLNDILYWQGEFPEETLAHLVDQLINQDEQTKPILRQVVENTIKDYTEIPEDFVGHVYAIYLLAQFRDSAGFELALKLLALPEPYPEKLLHDFLSQSFPAVVASCYGGNPSPLFALIDRQDVSYLSKVVGLVSLSILANRKSLSPEVLIGFLDGLLDRLAMQKNSKLLAALVEEVADLHLTELYPKIKELYSQKCIDEEQYGLKAFDAAIESTYQNPKRFFLIEDIFEELNGKEYRAT